MYEFEQPVPDMQSVEDVLAYIRARASKATEPGRWITLSQVFITRLREQRYPTRAELDQAAPRHPGRLPHRARRVVEFMAPSNERHRREVPACPTASRAASSATARRQPTGILRNCGRFIRSQSTGSSPTTADRLDRLRQLLADYNSVGITSIVDGNADDAGVELYRTLLANASSRAARSWRYGVDAQAPIDRVEAAIRRRRRIRCTSTTTCCGCAASRRSSTAAC